MRRCLWTAAALISAVSASQDGQRVISDESIPSTRQFWNYGGVGALKSGWSDEELLGDYAIYAGIQSFAHLPVVNCFAQELDDPKADKYDVAILGAPFDTAVTYRTGARFGPSGIRRGSQRIVPTHAYDKWTRKNPFNSGLRAVDCSDVSMTPMDNSFALAQLETAYKRVISHRPANESLSLPAPRVLMLGGDHTVTLPALRALFPVWGQMHVVHFDSHVDTWDPKKLGGVTDYAKLNHGTFLHIGAHEGLISNGSMHAGIRCPVQGPDVLDDDVECGFHIIHAREMDVKGPHAIANMIKEAVGNAPVYVSVDIDVLDPASAPATGTPEVGGWSTRELMTVLEGLQGINIVGGDVVEVAPAYDHADITALAASQVVVTLLSLMSESHKS